MYETGTVGFIVPLRVTSTWSFRRGIDKGRLPKEAFEMEFKGELV